MGLAKKALILGISGQDGAYLSRLLLDNGYEVYGTSRDSELNDFYCLNKLNIYKDINISTMALNNFDSVYKVFKKIKPDEIYNLAGQSSVGLSFSEPFLTFESIIDGTLNCLEAIRKIDNNIKFYNASSSECFGDTGKVSADENTVFKPESPYAVAKSAAHWAVKNYRKSYGLFAVSGILFNHESPFRPKSFVTQKIISSVIDISQGKKDFIELGNIDIQRDWGWAPEYVNAMFLMMHQNEADDYVIATGDTHALKDFVSITFDYFGLDWQEHLKVSTSLIRPSDLAISRGNPLKAEQKLGWKSKFNLNQIIHELIESSLS